MKKRSQVQSLSIDETSIAMEACLTNAEQLLEESKALAQIDHYARAYFLCHTACEELAKFFIFQIAGKRTAQGKPPHWRRFWQRLRSHDSKLAQIEVRARVRAKSDAVDEYLLIDAGLDLLSMYGTLPRNMGLYVEQDPNGAFRKPSDIDWNKSLEAMRALVLHLYVVAKEVGTSAEKIATALREQPTDQDREHAREAITHIVRQLQSAGVTKDDIMEQFQKYLRTSAQPTKPQAD